MSHNRDIISHHQEQKPHRTQTVNLPQREPIKPLTLISIEAKFDEIEKIFQSKKPDTKRIKDLSDSIYEYISKVKDPETLISQNHFFTAFKACYDHREILPECWEHCENKLINFIYDPRYFGLFYNQSKRDKIRNSFPTQNIKKALSLFNKSIS